jgi:hypothetical protein
VWEKFWGGTQGLVSGVSLNGICDRLGLSCYTLQVKGEIKEKVVIIDIKVKIEVKVTVKAKVKVRDQVKVEASVKVKVTFKSRS